MGHWLWYEGENTADNYIRTLKKHLLPDIEAANGPVWLQQDNASIHKTAAVMAFMEENEIQTMKWPPQSPDLSPIENIWNRMERSEDENANFCNYAGRDPKYLVELGG